MKEKSKEYFFLAKNTAIEKKRKIFLSLHDFVAKEVIPISEAGAKISQEQLKNFPLRIRQLFHQVCFKGPGFLKDIEAFIQTHRIVPTKILSLHAQNVACVNKGKVGKPYEFGRVFQLGRIGGNFLLIAKARSILENDRHAAPQMLYEHRRIFGVKTLKSMGSDKGYYSKNNIIFLKRANIPKIAIQMPKNIKTPLIQMDNDEQIHFKNRRAGIEPLIGHLKNGGFRKSRMKSDYTTEISAYRCVTGFNLRQFVRHIEVGA